jgi:RNase P subunit RPR2
MPKITCKLCGKKMRKTYVKSSVGTLKYLGRYCQKCNRLVLGKDDATQKRQKTVITPEGGGSL